MDASMINAVTVPPVAANGLVASEKALAGGGLDFAQILTGLQNGDPTALAGQGTTGGLAGNWLNLLGFGQGLSSLQNLNWAQTDGGTEAGMDGLAEKIMELLAGLRKESSQDSEGLLNLVQTLQKELQATGGQMAAGQQLMVLLAQLSGQTLTPVLQEDGSLDLSLSGGGEKALQALTTASAEDVVQMLGGDKALFEQTLQGLSTPAAAQAAAQAGPTHQSPIQPSVTPLNASTSMAAEPRAEEAPLAAMAETRTASVPAAGQNAPANGSPAEALPGKTVTSPKPAEDTKLPLHGESLTETSQTFSLRPGVVTTGNLSAASSPAPVATQLQEGIQNGLQTGLDEFSIKLMPEGLGEVTVRLKATEAGLKLTLVAKSAETQRLLGAELDQLRETLRPMRVEVQEVLTSRQEQMLSNQQSFQNQQQQRAWQEMHGAAYYRDEPLSGSEETEALPLPAAEAPRAALDAYI